MRKPVSASRQEPCRESEVALSVVTIVDQLFCRRAETLTMSNALFPAAPSYKKETQNAVFLPDTSDPTFPQCKNTNATPQPTRFRQAGNKRRKTAIERQHIVNGLQELLKIFKVSCLIHLPKRFLNVNSETSDVQKNVLFFTINSHT